MDSSLDIPSEARIRAINKYLKINEKRNDDIAIAKVMHRIPGGYFVTKDDDGYMKIEDIFEDE